MSGAVSRRGKRTAAEPTAGSPPQTPDVVITTAATPKSSPPSLPSVSSPATAAAKPRRRPVQSPNSPSSPPDASARGAAPVSPPSGAPSGVSASKGAPTPVTSPSAPGAGEKRRRRRKAAATADGSSPSAVVTPAVDQADSGVLPAVGRGAAQKRGVSAGGASPITPGGVLGSPTATQATATPHGRHHRPHHHHPHPADPPTRLVPFVPVPRRLITYKELAPWAQDNEYILGSYRPLVASVAAALWSLLYVHNETANQWSHLLAGLAVLATAAHNHLVWLPARGAAGWDHVGFGLFEWGASTMLLCSALLHTMMAHSQKVASACSQIDYAGIVAMIWGSVCAVLVIGFREVPGVLLAHVILQSTAAGLCIAFTLLPVFQTPRFRPIRAFAFAVLGLLTAGPAIHFSLIACYPPYAAAYCDHVPKIMRLLVAEGGSYLFGALLFAVRFPEAKWPGNFDVWGQSHSLFHGCVVLSTYLHMLAAREVFSVTHPPLAAAAAAAAPL